MRLEKFSKILLSQIIGTEVIPPSKPSLPSNTGLSVLSLCFGILCPHPREVLHATFTCSYLTSSSIFMLLTEGT